MCEIFMCNTEVSVEAHGLLFDMIDYGMYNFDYQVEGEISTLRQVLGSKVRYASELKRLIGITPFQELKHDFSEGIKSIQQSDT